MSKMVKDFSYDRSTVLLLVNQILWNSFLSKVTQYLQRASFVEKLLTVNKSLLLNYQKSYIPKTEGFLKKKKLNIKVTGNKTVRCH